MALTDHYYTKFETGNYYHVYNRSVDKKPMFKNDGNYRFFLNQYNHYLANVVETYTYCLLGNHFHLLVCVADLTALDLTTFGKLSNLESPEEEINTRGIVSHQFRKFFQSYAMAFNKQQGRTGTLFQTPFKRVRVATDQYFNQLVYYIHANPQMHGLVDDFRDWKWSSYTAILTDKPTQLKRQQVLEWFGSIEVYREFHSVNQKLIYNENYILEDD